MSLSARRRINQIANLMNRLETLFEHAYSKQEQRHIEAAYENLRHASETAARTARYPINLPADFPRGMAPRNHSGQATGGSHV